ncbi:hypothetical protein PHYSODRAFT_536177 [Phytophthora sojae]|uniref:Uncharacterized protein n=1 Tax=Phytophthora sojae (strain P6497) TaxID=1094619 RepID=G5AAF5_PHYSP|nr:hypothetical protein PHYSODRAFT_528060 [Phytophthora sojae]XP_009540036.1 hypothetical protein PHYSODRAFT_536177 [Phytophthora sojae]EGZ04540.1 hypothetical protein PHYSODRAFT_536177 [Phytophthora sojae]EGZ07584.1 hypothetical protein PHYSODRAFT_528060 [Phytophthora sojae]|eukprot:XP_009537150.1 hypothetical protein PHYSODRAFT_528060 [Phytophthora sojae]
MDIQMIGNAYGAAEYTAAYVSKAEPDTLRFRSTVAAAVKRCDPNLPYSAIQQQQKKKTTKKKHEKKEDEKDVSAVTVLKRIANATLAVREVSAQEAYFILLRELKMYGKSRKVSRVKVLRHHLRYYRSLTELGHRQTASTR